MKASPSDNNKGTEDNEKQEDDKKDKSQEDDKKDESEPELDVSVFARPRVNVEREGPMFSPTEDGDTRSKLMVQAEQMLYLLTRYGALYGTGAVIICYFTGVDPFGNFHVDPSQLALGSLLSLPVLIADGAIMLPDWSKDLGSGPSPSSSEALPTSIRTTM